MSASNTLLQLSQHEIFEFNQHNQRMVQIMNIQPRDTSDGHFFVSLAKSAIRILAGVSLLYGSLVICGVLLIVAEVLGIVEELV